MDTVYRVVLEFETREEAESCIEVVGAWEVGDTDVAPPDNPFVTHSIEELIRLVKESE